MRFLPLWVSFYSTPGYYRYLSVGQRSRVLWRSPGEDLSAESILHWHNLTLLFRSNDRELYLSPSEPRPRCRQIGARFDDSVSSGDGFTVPFRDQLDWPRPNVLHMDQRGQDLTRRPGNGAEGVGIVRYVLVKVNARLAS